MNAPLRSLAYVCCAGLASVALSTGGTRLPREAAARVVAARRNVQERLVTIRVVADADDTPLANAEVIDRSTGARALTRENGEARVRIPSSGVLLLRVRQLGFAYLDLDLEQGTLPSEGDAPLRIRLKRIPFALPPVATVTSRACPPIDDNVRPLALWALDQLREGAERYETFRKAYPFRVEIQRRTVVRTGVATPRVTMSRERGNSDRWGERYVPGGVVELRSLGFTVPILFVATLGDPAFWDHHCVTTAQVEGDDSLRMVRLRFTPSPEAKGSDWGGDALMDSSTSLLRRVEFHLKINQRDGPRRFEGFTTFHAPSPLIAVPESTFAMWWRSEPADGAPWGLPHVVQLLHAKSIEFRKAKPPR